MKNDELKLVPGGQLEQLKLPVTSQSEAYKLNSLSSESGVLYLGNGEDQWNIIPETDTSIDLIAQSLLTKIRHWFPFGAQNQGLYQDVFGGLEMQPFTNVDPVDDQPSLSSDSTRRSTYFPSAGGCFMHGKPSWMYNGFEIHVASFVKRVESTATAIFMRDGPTGPSGTSSRASFEFSLPYNSTTFSHKLGWYDNSNTFQAVTSNAVSPVADAAFIAIGRNPTSKLMYFNLNGVPENRSYSFINPSASYATASGNRFTIGASQNGTTIGNTTGSSVNSLTGHLQDFVICDKVLTEEELSWLYNGNKGRSLHDLYKAAKQTHYWTPAQLSRKLVWAVSDHVDNVVASGLVTNLENRAGVRGAAYSGIANRCFRNNYSTLNGRNVLSAVDGNSLGHFIFARTNYAGRMSNMTGCCLILVVRPLSPSTTSTRTEAYIANQSVNNVKLNIARVSGRYTTYGRRLPADSAQAGPESESISDWAILIAQNNYTVGTIELKVNGAAKQSSTVYTTGVSEASSGAANRVVSIGGTPFDANDTAGESEVAEFLAFDAPITDEQMTLVEGYLAHSWALTHLLPVDHPYKTNAPVV